MAARNPLFSPQRKEWMALFEYLIWLNQEYVVFCYAPIGRSRNQFVAHCLLFFSEADEYMAGRAMKLYV